MGNTIQRSTKKQHKQSKQTTQVPREDVLENFEDCDYMIATTIAFGGSMLKNATTVPNPKHHMLKNI